MAQFRFVTAANALENPGWTIDNLSSVILRLNETNAFGLFYLVRSYFGLPENDPFY